MHNRKYCYCFLGTTCPRPVGILHGAITMNSAATSLLYHVDTLVRYTCDEGYWVSRNVTSIVGVCQENGRWNISLNVVCLS